MGQDLTTARNLDRAPTTNGMLTVKQVAERLNIPQTAVYALASGGELANIRIGRRVRIQTSDLDAYLTTRRVTTPRHGRYPAT